MKEELKEKKKKHSLDILGIELCKNFNHALEKLAEDSSKENFFIRRPTMHIFTVNKKGHDEWRVLALQVGLF